MALENRDDTELVLVTFNNSSLDSFAVATYALWTLKDSMRTASLLLSKAKLAPILQISDAYHNELCSAVFAPCLKTWIQDQTDLRFSEHVPFLDSKIVQSMILKDSYSFGTFTGLRVA